MSKKEIVTPVFSFPDRLKNNKKIIAALFFWVFAATLFAIPLFYDGLLPVQRLQYIFEAFSVLIQTAFLMGLIALVYFTWRRVEMAEERIAISEQRQISERFTRAVDQLGAVGSSGDPRMEIRLGGIYALERIAEYSQDNHRTVMEILTAYVRSNAGGKTKGSTLVSDEIQSIILVIGRQKWAGENGETLRLNLAGCHLAGALFAGAKLPGINLSGAVLTGASMVGTDLRSANLMAADLKGANLHTADCSGSFLSGADLTGASLLTANFEKADLSGANLRGVNLEGANLREANLDNTDLREATLAGANLSGARLMTADLREADLSGANLQGATGIKTCLRRANLSDANLQGSNLTEADLKGADLSKAYLKGTRLTGANLTATSIPSVEGLLQAGTLSGASLDPYIEHQVKEKNPKLLEAESSTD